MLEKPPRVFANRTIVVPIRPPSKLLPEVDCTRVVVVCDPPGFVPSSVCSMRTDGPLEAVSTIWLVTGGWLMFDWSSRYCVKDEVPGRSEVTKSF